MTYFPRQHGKTEAMARATEQMRSMMTSFQWATEAINRLLSVIHGMNDEAKVRAIVASQRRRRHR